MIALFHAHNAVGMSLLIVGHLALGIVLGLVYFRTLWWNARLLAEGSSLSKALGLMVLRLAILGGVLVLTSFEGALPLLVTMLGILASRFVILRRVRAASS